jgi:hypothetical protein
MRILDKGVVPLDFAALGFDGAPLQRFLHALDDPHGNLLVTGPNGYSLFGDFQKAKRAKGGTIVTATYLAPAPGGIFDAGDNGLYSILVQPGAVRDLANTTTNAGLLDQFLVSSNVRPQSPALHAASPASAALTLAGEDDGDELRKLLGL